MNAATLSIAGARLDLMGYKPDTSIPSACVSDVCTVTGAYVAAGLLLPVKWVVGCGVEPQPLAPQRVSGALTMQQHGIVGYALRAVAAKAGDLCGVAMEKNSGISLADATTAALRLILLTLPEATIVSLFFLMSTPIQLILDFGAVIHFFCQLGAKKLSAIPSLAALGSKGAAESTQPAAKPTTSEG